MGPSGSGALAGAPGLAPLFEAFAALEDGTAGAPVVLVQLGDSHTAGDAFTGRLRARLQDRFGDAGRGMLPPGEPFDYYAPTDVAVEQSDGWTVHRAGRTGPGDPPIGLAGFAVTSADPDATIRALPDPAAPLPTRASLGVARGPGGGTLAVTVEPADGEALTYRVVTEGRQPRLARFALPPAGPIAALSLAPVGDGPVTLTDVTLERDGPGIALDSHGLVGATVAVLDAADRLERDRQLAARDPAAVLVAFGTNEAFSGIARRDAYALAFRDAVGALADAVPDAAILVVGPPDGNRRPEGCSAEETTICLGDPTRAAEAAADGLCAWTPPADLATVQGVQAGVAAVEGWAFWDWRETMGGACGMHDLATAEPPLAWPDHVHLTPDGYARSADTLFDDLMGAYAAWRAGTPVAAAGRPGS
ncbi:MAG: GDSL-type esterase/lipase family protein [Azospirillaceae bacterium]